MRANNKDSIFAAARSVLAEKGYEKTSVSEIVKRSGVTQAAFYLYFPSKASVLSALAEEMFGQLHTELARATTGQESVVETLQVGSSILFEVIARYADILPVLHASSALVEVVDKRPDLFNPLHTWVEQVLTRGLQSGELEQTLDVPLTSRYIVHLLERAAEDAFVYRSDLPKERHLKSVLSFIYAALGPKLETHR